MSAPSKALVGPLRKVTFRGGPDSYERLYVRHEQAPYVAYTPPRNTCDPRYAACTEHHVACDCREAEWAEERQEWQYERDEARRAFAEVLAGHNVGSQYDHPGDVCQCTGCQIARRVSWLVPHDLVFGRAFERMETGR